MAKNVVSGICRYCGCTENAACYNPDNGSCWWVNDEQTICSHCVIEHKKQKAKHNLIYRIRKANLGRIDTRAKMIYYFFEEVEKVLTRKHKRLQEDFGFSIQSELVK